MRATTRYPGIHINEALLSNYTVTLSNTAIPAFIFKRTDDDDSPIGNSISCYHSWQEFNATQSREYPDKNYYRSLYGWFMSGGGKCYLVNINEIDLINQYDDITLLVTAGIVENNQAIFDAFTRVINNGQPIFGLFDTPDKKIEAADEAEKVMETFPSSPQIAAFYPWCHMGEILIPPSVIAAVAIAKTDNARGVWKGPANLPIQGITPKYPVSDELQRRFSQGKVLNMIRNFPDLGTVLWGERTLEESDNWRYISVRRLFSTVEKEIGQTLKKVIFEPNSQPSWQRVKVAVTNYLYRLWQQGALFGNKAEQAYFVNIGKEITMTDRDINQGKMILRIGLAAVRPAEFILLQFSQDIAQ